jgi:uncharacterized protein (TIGR02246 family)
MKPISSVLLVLALVLASGCAPKVNDPADVQAITALVNDYAKAVNAKDVAASVAGMTETMRYYEAHMPAFVGKRAIEQFHRAWFDQFDAEFAAPVVDVRVSGDLGVAQGTWTQKLTPKGEGAAAITDSGNWTIVAQRQADGAWKMEWVIPNSDQPMPGTTADGAEEQALLQIERDFATAAKSRDMAFFERTLAKEFTQVSDGKPVNVAAQLAELKAGILQIESITMRDMRAYVFGDAAIVSMESEGKITYKGKPVSDKSRGVDFFVKRDGRWQVVHSQMTTIKE